VNRGGVTPLRWAPGPLHRSDACFIGFESHQGLVDHQTMPFVGAIDELVIYRRALREPEIAAHARRGGW
jgi:hypothetical protein